ncbi:MAG: ImmA/IrrE family metallo-endopeptidase [Clostridia bacterium]|nr:ImmA/IrrE family metallo-endopeptidase [Clostridia bacterium]
MLLRPEIIHRKAAQLKRRCPSGRMEQLAESLGIHLHDVDGLDRLLGMYTCRHKERHILLNARMEEAVRRMVCAHEIGHDTLHRHLAGGSGLQEFVLFDMRNETEYEANALAAHLLVEDDELIDLMKQGYDVVQLAAMTGTNVNLLLIKLNEYNRMGWQLDLPYLPRADFLKDLAPEGQ